MTIETIKEIIKAEKLTSFNLFEDRTDASDEMIIKKLQNQWIVYATNERAGIISGSEKLFNNEEEALNNFLRRLRALNKVIQLTRQ